MSYTIHWIVFFFVVAGFFLLFLTHPGQTSTLMGTVVTGVSGISGAMKNYVAGQAAS